MIKREKSSVFLDINARLFCNKSNGQYSLALPKKKLKSIIDLGDNESIHKVRIPKNIPIRIFRWRNE